MLPSKLRTLTVLAAMTCCSGFVVRPLAAPIGTHPAPSHSQPHSVSLECCAGQDVANLPPVLANTVERFKIAPNNKLRYQQLLFLARNLVPMDDALQVEVNKVPGCLSTVFVHAEKCGDRMYYTGTSDAQLTRGLLALLIDGLAGCTNKQIQMIDASFIHTAGLAQSLTPGRNSGFVNMLALMKQKAAALSG